MPATPPKPPPKIAPSPMLSRERLKAWLKASGRDFLVFHVDELVDALPYPEGIEQVQQMVQLYEERRAMFVTKWVEGESPIMKTGHLELAEARQLADQVMSRAEDEECQRIANGARRV